MKKVLVAIASTALALFGFSTQVFAEPLGKENANVLTTCAEDNNGIQCLLGQAVDILSIGIGIFGVIGILIVGIQYLTAGGNEEKTRKAKRRMFEIVIGLVAYAVIYALLKFLLPGFNGVNNS